MSFSRDPKKVLQDALASGYSRVRFQQGKPLLDRELNLLGDLANPTRIAEPYIGSGVPAGSNGFAITNLDVADSDFTISAGRCLVDGNEVVLARNRTYKTQPHKEKVAAFPAGTFGVYLRVFATEITDLEDSDLQNTGDVGFVTAIRERTDWEVVVSVAPPRSNHYQLATINPATNKITDMRRRGLTLETLRDEVNSDRETTQKVGARLDVSLTANGDLKPNVVLETNIANNAISKRTIQDKAVPLTKLGLTQVVVDQQVVVPAANGGVPGEQTLNLQSADEFAFFLISVRQVEPRPPLPIPIGFAVNWLHRVMVQKGPGQGSPYVHIHQVLFQNPGPTPQTVACRAFRISDT